MLRLGHKCSLSAAAPAAETICCSVAQGEHYWLWTLDVQAQGEGYLLTSKSSKSCHWYLVLVSHGGVMRESSCVSVTSKFLHRTFWFKRASQPRDVLFNQQCHVLEYLNRSLFTAVTKWNSSIFYLENCRLLNGLCFLLHICHNNSP